jgi:hypothetical protein
MLPLDGKLLNAAEETGSLEKTTSVFCFVRGFLELGCLCNWAAFGLRGRPAWYVVVCLSRTVVA